MKKYREIFTLKEMLEKANIPFDWIESWGYSEKELEKLRKIAPDLVEHYHICYPCQGDKMKISVIEGFGTYGEDQDLLEIMGGLTPEEQENDVVLGWLDAVDVFDRIKKDYERSKKQ